MLLEPRILAGPINPKRRDRTADYTSIRIPELELIARLQAEVGIVQDGARGPRLRGHTRDQRDAQPGAPPQYPQNGLHRLQPVEGRQIGLG